MKVLVVIDFQVDFITGELAYNPGADLEGPIYNKIMEYRNNGDLVLFTLDWHDPEDYLNTQEGRRLPIKHCTTAEGRAVFGKVAQFCTEENSFKKPGFGSPELCEYLRELNPEQIEFCGTYVTPCLLSNAVMAKAFCREARIVVDATCTTTPDKDINEKALDVLNNMQIDIINRDKVSKDQVRFYK